MVNLGHVGNAVNQGFRLEFGKPTGNSTGMSSS